MHVACARGTVFQQKARREPKTLLLRGLATVHAYSCESMRFKNQLSLPLTSLEVDGTTARRLPTFQYRALGDCKL
jgi:hypothetical protein